MPSLQNHLIGKVDLNFSAYPALGAERKHIANNQHPDHQHRVNRGPARVRVIRRQLLVHPTQIEQTVDLPHQMIGRNHLVEIKRIEKLSLIRLPAAPSCAAPADALSTNGITDRESSQREFCNTIPPKVDIVGSLRHVRFVRQVRKIELLLRPHRSNRENWIGSRGRTKEDTGAPVT